MSIDPRPENAPLEVQQREAQKMALMMSADNHSELPPDDDLSDEEKSILESGPVSPTHPKMRPGEIPRQQAMLPRDPLEAFSELLKNYGDHQEIKVYTPIGSIVLRALHVSVNQTSVGMILNKDDVRIEPTFGSELLIEVGGRQMNVIYGGGLFTFKKIPVTFLSFFRVSEDSDSSDPGELT